MPKSLTESHITTRSARAVLAPGLYWRGVDPDVHLGYRKSRRGGSWLVRWRDGTGYKRVGIGTADDVIKEGTIDFATASRLARETVERARAKASAFAAGPLPTVQHAVEAYVSLRDARESRRTGRAVRSDANRRLSRHVIGAPARGKQPEIAPTKLAALSLHELTEADLQAWRRGLPDTLKTTTIRRLVNDLRAALNSSGPRFRDRLNPRFSEIVKHGLAIENDEESGSIGARDSQILTDVEVARLVKAAREVDQELNWEGDLFSMVLALAATGARFSQIARTPVGNLQTEAGRILVPVSRKGRGTKNGTTTVPLGDDVMSELASVARDRPADAMLLERWRHRQEAGGVNWIRAGRAPWRSSSELVRPWATIRTKAGLPNAIPYALRHSSIVRGIRAGLPIRLVAAVHDTSVAMIEKHYARWIVDGLEDFARRAVVPIV